MRDVCMWAAFALVAVVAMALQWRDRCQRRREEGERLAEQLAHEAKLETERLASAERLEVERVHQLGEHIIQQHYHATLVDSVSTGEIWQIGAMLAARSYARANERGQA